MSETAFHYDPRRLNHRIGASVATLAIVLLIAMLLPDASALLLALLVVGFIVVLLQIFRFQRLRANQGPAITLSDEGLDVTAWGLGVVPWSEIKSARRVARSNIQVVFKHPQEWKGKMTLLKRVLGVLETVFGTGSFTIDGGLLKDGPHAVLKEIQARLGRGETGF
ncbi:MAG: hypothetical protein ACE5NW_09325 [Acidiferrobacterales bacterium]